jgi:hypothetical protein
MKKLVIFLALMIFPFFAFTATNWIVVAGFSPGSAVIPEEGKESLAELVENQDPEGKVIRIIGLADTLHWNSKSFSEGEVADTTLAYKRAEAVALFYESLGWQTEIISIQNFIPRYRGHRGVQIQLAEKDVPLIRRGASSERVGDLILKVTSKSGDSIKSEEHKISADELIKDWEDGDPAVREIIFNVPVDTTKNDTLSPKTVFAGPKVNWTFNAGLRAWSAGSPWDLLTPVAGFGLYKDNWGISLGGGFTPWERTDPLGNRKDALVYAELTSPWPKGPVNLKGGFMAGWEFFSESDNWTMKVLSPFLGLSYQWKMLEASLFYSPAKVSSLTEESSWKHGVMISFNVLIGNE